MSENAFVWAGMLAMMAVAVVLMLIALPVVENWRDDWRQYAHETKFGGVCSAEPAPPECADNPPVERWQIIPWMLTAGYAAALLVLCLPVEAVLRRSPEGGGRLRRAWNTMREQR